MRTVLLQTDIAWADPQENIRRLERLMADSNEPTKGTLFVLPEMWATGFCVEPEGIAEDEERSVALAWMKATARSKDCAISGSLAISCPTGAGERITYRNRHYFVTPDAITYYDKHHLFTHGHEDQRFTAGEEAVVVTWQGMRLLLQTCYDLRFPVFARYGRSIRTSHVSQSSSLLYDAIIYVANWPEKRQLAWDTLIRARAIENQCFVVAVNRVGSDPSCHYAGGSAIIDPLGRTIASCDDTKQWAEAPLTADAIASMRSRFRVLDDRDAL